MTKNMNLEDLTKEQAHKIPWSVNYKHSASICNIIY